MSKITQQAHAFVDEAALNGFTVSLTSKGIQLSKVIKNDKKAFESCEASARVVLDLAPLCGSVIYGTVSGSQKYEDAVKSGKFVINKTGSNFWFKKALTWIVVKRSPDPKRNAKKDFSVSDLKKGLWG